MSNRGMFWGADIGGTTTVIGFIDAFGEFKVYETLPTRPAEGPRSLMERIRRTVVESDPSPSAMGIGIAGLVDHLGGVLHFSPNLTGWGGTNVAADMRKLLGSPVVVDNDCNAFAHGAMGDGIIPRTGLRLLVTLGTGIGGTLIESGRIIYGTGFAGEVGHMPIEAVTGPPCPCGSRGCWERYAGRDALVSYYGGDPAEAPDPRGMAAEARSGSVRALEAFAEYGRWVGIGLAALAVCLSPDGMYLAGGLAGTGDLFEESARAEFSSRTRQPWNVAVVPGSAVAGAKGAAMMARDRRP